MHLLGGPALQAREPVDPGGAFLLGKGGLRAGLLEYHLGVHEVADALTRDQQPLVGQRLIGQHHRVARDAERMGERSEEHTSELQSLMRISYAVFCLKKKTNVSQIISKHQPSTTNHSSTV